MSMASRRALVVGDGVGGRTLAFWLLRTGWTVEIIASGDQSPAARQARLDLGGSAGEVVSRMGLADAASTGALPRMHTTYMTANGRVVPAGYDSPDGTSRPGVWTTEQHLCALIGQASGLDDLVRQDHIDAVGTSERAVHAYCHSGLGDYGYDVLVVADGMRSRTRGLTMERDIGLTAVPGELTRFALASGQDTPAGPHHRRHYTAGGRRSVTVETTPDGRTYVEMFHLPRVPMLIEDQPVETQKAFLSQHFDDVGWASQGLLQLFDMASDFTHHTFRAVQVLGPWWHGRSVLLGDAAHGRGAADGSGMSLDLIAGYVLAGHLTAHSDPVKAFSAYEAFMRPVVAAALTRRTFRLRQTHPLTMLGVKLLHRRHALMVLRPCEFGLSASDVGHVLLPPFLFLAR